MKILLQLKSNVISKLSIQFLLSTVLVAINFFAVAQPLTYIKTAQLNALNFGMALTPTSDSGYVMAGQDKQFVPPAQVYCYFYVSKIDKCGNVSNRTLFEISSSPRIRSCGARYVKETSDHKYIVTGALKQADPSLNPALDVLNLYAALVDINAGTLNWINIYRSPLGEAHGTCMAEAPDGYMVCGYVDAEPKTPYVAKLNKADGTVIWEKAFQSLNGLYSYGNYVDVFSNGDILLLGAHGNGTDNNFYAMRLSPTGTLIWSKEYDIGQYDGLDWDVSGKITQNGGFVLSGSTQTNGNYDCAIITADANGNVINAATFDNASREDRARSVTQLASGEFIQVGYTLDNSGNPNALINKLTPNLVPIWTEGLTLNNYSKGWGINEDTDHGLVFSGETQSGGNYDALFVKTDSMGILDGCNYLQPITLTATPVTPTVSSIAPTLTNLSYFKYAYSAGEKIVAAGSGSTTSFCYNCSPTFVVSTNKVCLHETMYVYSKPIRCSPQSIEIADTITSQTVAPESVNGDTTFYSFSIAGTYHITLSVNCNGVIQNTVKTIIVEPPPIASAGVDFVKCKYESVAMTGTGGAIYQWYNQDFSTLLSSSNPFNATDTADATYNVVVTDTNGCIDTAAITATVTLPYAQFISDTACLTHPTSFSDLSIVASQTFVAWSWDYGDNSAVDTAHNPTHIFPNPGLYNTTLISTTANGCKDTIKKPVLVYPLPQVNYYMVPAPQGICDGTTVNFHDTSTIASPYSLEAWQWNFGDATAFVSTENSSHLYAAPGTYDVQLNVTSNTGCSDSIVHTLTINPNPVVNFRANPRIGCEPLCVTFQDSSTILTGNNIQYLWDIGTGNPATSTQFEHCYINDSVFAPIYFDITLTVTSDSGCVSTLTKNNYITVYPNPEAFFDLDPTYTTVVDPTVTVVDHSIGTNFWNWNYGDSHVDSTSKPPTHLYRPDTATYLVTLITSTQYGCLDTAYNHIIIGPDFTFYIPNAFTPNGDGANDYFFGSGIGISIYDLWVFDRWGNMIFHGNDLNDKWDGKANQGDKSAQQDVFIWKVTLTDVFDKKHQYIGTVTLIH